MTAERRVTPAPRATVLIVSEQESEASRLAAACAAAGLAPIRVHSQDAAANALDQHPVDALVTRLRTARIRGLRLLALARERHPGAGGVLIIDKGEEEQATQAMSRGVIDFQLRPINADRAVALILQNLERQRLELELLRSQRRLELRYGLAGLIGESGAMVQVLAQVRELAPLEDPVLVLGEPGTGRSHLARVLHEQSLRRLGPFVVCDCAALPPRHALRELFGAAGTGRAADRPGRLEQSDRGTLFLREVASLTREAQGRVAEVLQTKMLRPGLGRAHREVRVRLIASATIGPASPAIEEGLHEALQAQCEGAHIVLPPLRHRRRDVALLARHFMAEAAVPGAPVPALDAEALDLLEAYTWPGNVAELRATIRQGMLLLGGRTRLQATDLPAEIRSPATRGDAVVLSLGASLEEAERRMVAETMRMARGNREAAARILGISLRTLYRKLKAFGIGDLSD